MKAFEIHTYQGGRWKIDSVFDDRDLAVFEAQRMDVSGRYPGVRVIEETFNEASNESTTRTIFRGAKVAKANEEEFQKSATVRRQVVTAREERKVKSVVRQRQLKRQAVQKKSSPIRLIVILLVLACFAGGALFGLSYLDQMM
ncbi:MAG: hypothetical protein HQ514_07595 [Rhodospirillales bacterium]|nr:hypothetical protein [Rhodospirillales bacterium]